MAQIQNDPSALAPVENICGRATGTKYASLADCQRTPCVERANAAATKGRRNPSDTPALSLCPAFLLPEGAKPPTRTLLFVINHLEVTKCRKNSLSLLLGASRNLSVLLL